MCKRIQRCKKKKNTYDVCVFRSLALGYTRGKGGGGNRVKKVWRGIRKREFSSFFFLFLYLVDLEEMYRDKP